MEASVLKIVGQVAGIGGLALGVLLLLFRQVIAKNIFASLTKEQSYRLLRLILTFVWSIAALGIVAWLISGRLGSTIAIEDQTWKRNYSYVASREFPQIKAFGRIDAPPSEQKQGDFKDDFLADIKALVLTDEPELEAKRDSLVALVEGAPSIDERNPGIFVVDEEIQALYRQFKIQLRAAAVKRNVDVEKLEREKFVRPQ